MPCKTAETVGELLMVERLLIKVSMNVARECKIANISWPANRYLLHQLFLALNLWRAQLLSLEVWVISE
jgi:hypothetical protein